MEIEEILSQTSRKFRESNGFKKEITKWVVDLAPTKLPTVTHSYPQSPTVRKIIQKLFQTLGPMWPHLNEVISHLGPPAAINIEGASPKKVLFLHSL